MMKIKYYKTDTGIILSGVDPKNIGLPIINEIQSRKSFNDRWIIVDGIENIESLAYKVMDREINKRYIRRENTPDSLPEIIYAGKEPDFFDSVRDLYKYKSDGEPQPHEYKEFEAEFLGEFKMAALGDPTTFQFHLSPNRDFQDQTGLVNYASLMDEYPWGGTKVSVDEIIKALSPEFTWHLYPCFISSDIAYRIIRYHVSQNIDGRYAKITSDYDFCFTVSKLIPVKPWVSRNEILNTRGKSYRPPRISEKKITHKEEVIFEMTPATKKYRGYTVIEGFNGSTLEELRQNIVRYLDDLMAVINHPLELCSCCEGRGLIGNIKIGTNERFEK